jgi:hypothetical protein
VVAAVVEGVAAAEPVSVSVLAEEVVAVAAVVEVAVVVEVAAVEGAVAVAEEGHPPVQARQAGRSSCSSSRLR